MERLLKLHEIRKRISELREMSPEEDGWSAVDFGLDEIEQSISAQIVRNSSSLDDMLDRYVAVISITGNSPSWDDFPHWGVESLHERLYRIFYETICDGIVSWDSERILIADESGCRIESIAYDVSLPENPDPEIVRFTGSEHLARLALEKIIHDEYLECARCHLPGTPKWQPENEKHAEILLKRASSSALDQITELEHKHKKRGSMAPNIEIELEGKLAIWWAEVNVTYLGNEQTMDDPGCGPEWEVLENTIARKMLEDDGDETRVLPTLEAFVEDLGGQGKFDELVGEQVVEALNDRAEDYDDRWYSHGGYRF